MPKQTLPEHPGTFRVQTAKAGNFIVINDKTGKNQVIITCRNKSHADEVCKKINSGNHNGEVWI